MVIIHQNQQKIKFLVYCILNNKRGSAKFNSSIQLNLTLRAYIMSDITQLFKC